MNVANDPSIGTIDIEIERANGVEDLDISKPDADGAKNPEKGKGDTKKAEDPEIITADVVKAEDLDISKANVDGEQADRTKNSDTGTANANIEGADGVNGVEEPDTEIVNLVVERVDKADGTKDPDTNIANVDRAEDLDTGITDVEKETCRSLVARRLGTWASPCSFRSFLLFTIGNLQLFHIYPLSISLLFSINIIVKRDKLSFK